MNVSDSNFIQIYSLCYNLIFIHILQRSGTMNTLMATLSGCLVIVLCMAGLEAKCDLPSSLWCSSGEVAKQCGVRSLDIYMFIRSNNINIWYTTSMVSYIIIQFQHCCGVPGAGELRNADYFFIINKY